MIDTFPTCSFINGYSISRCLPVVEDHKGVLQGCIDWEASSSSDDLIIL